MWRAWSRPTSQTWAITAQARLLEYGVARVVVLGHARCGGVKAMIEGAPKEACDFVESWVAIAQPDLLPILEPTGTDDMLDHYETEVLRLSLANLNTFPRIAEAVAEGRLQLHGFRFDIRTGALTKLGGKGLVPVV
jgi:carbonic anhydrase